MNKYLVVSLHDMHDGSRELIDQQVQFFQNLGVNCFSILTVPRFHGAEGLSATTCAWLSERQKQGDDLVLHGYYHDRHDRKSGSWFYTRFYTANEAEFLDLLDEEVLQRLDLGMQIWQEHGWRLSGFIAPAWLMPTAQDALLRQKGFAYTTRLKTFHGLLKEQSVTSQSLCYSTRARWRVVASLAWNHYLFDQIKNQSLVRLSMHPHDLRTHAIKKQITNHVRLLLDNGFQPITYADYAAL